MKESQIFKEDGKDIMLFTPNGFLDLDSEFIKRKVKETLKSKKFTMIIMVDELILNERVTEETYNTYRLYKDESKNIVCNSSTVTIDLIINEINKVSKNQNVLCAVSDIIFELVKFQLATSHVIESAINDKLRNKTISYPPTKYENMDNLQEYLNILLENI